MINYLQENSEKIVTMNVQSVLKKLGLYNGKVDGILGEDTRAALRDFQAKNGIPPTGGIIGPLTEKQIEKYHLGYELYTVEENDTLNSIAKKLNSTLNLILSANPNIVTSNIPVGTIITVPYNYELVLSDVKYTYDTMKIGISGLNQRYPFLKVSVIGKSVLGKDIYLIKFGKGDKKIHYNATHHALEWINSVFFMQFIERICYALISSEKIEGYDIYDIYNKCTLYFVPMVNPDGVDLVQKGLSIDNPYYKDLMKWNDTGKPFDEVWQANIRGVDLNHNYKAEWEKSKEQEEKMGIYGPGPTRFSGPYPFSEPETIAIKNLTENENFYMALAYHTQGEIIYWNFNNLGTERDKQIGQELADVSGYTLDTAQGVSSYAGYKDWFIQDFGKPGYTIETGKGKNPLPITELPKIYAPNVKLILKSTQL